MPSPSVALDGLQGDAAPLLSIDRLVLRFSFHADGLDGEAVEQNHHSARLAGVTSERSTPTRVKFRVPLISGADDAENFAPVELTVPPRGVTAGLIYGFVAIYPLRHLRALIGDEAAGPRALDNKANVIGPTDAFPDIERTCVDLVHIAMQEALGAVQDLLGPGPVLSDGECWLSGFEATRDLPMPEAPAMAWRVAHSVLSGSRFVSRDLYSSRRGLRVDRGYASCRFYQRATGAAVKVYAKRDDLLRIEWVLDHREAVRREADRERADLSADAAAGLVESTLAAARGALAAAQTEVLDVCSGVATPADVALALLPLLRLGDPDGPAARGRPAAVPPDALARRAFDALWLTGQCAVTGEGARGRLRQCLDRLTELRALRRGSSSLCYTLAPRLVRGISTCGIQAIGEGP